MTASTPCLVESFVLRGNYPNLYARFAERRDQSPRPDLPGYRAAQVEYQLKGCSETAKIPVRGVDIPILNNPDAELGCHYLSLLIQARQGNGPSLAEVNRLLQPVQDENDSFCDHLELLESAHVVPSFTRNEYQSKEISHKGLNLITMSQQGYPVPDFSILTTSSYQASDKDRQEHLRQALLNLELMTERKLGSSSQPLIVAMRYAMPSYIPGLMPTYLNAGITEDTFDALCNIYGLQAGRKMIFNNLKNLRLLLAEIGSPLSSATLKMMDQPGDLADGIGALGQEIKDLDSRLLEDAFYQIHFLDRCSSRFFQENQDLIFTLSHGRAVAPALILQQMICTVRGKESYPGVLYSRNPNTGRHFLVETVRSIFGEEIMTGNVAAQVNEFADREQIKEEFPALYHFAPSLRVLEKEFASTVTAEFASESVRIGHFFALLQLNESELTGRAALVSAMDMYHEGLLPKNKVPGQVRPFHFRQIMSDTIDEDAFDSLEFFSSGYSILPRSAISGKVYFTPEAAMKARSEGEDRICLCRERFLPADAVVIENVDAILSLTPAAIHLVTTCRGQGTLAFLDLETYGVQLREGRCLVNEAGLTIEEGDWITISSRRKKVYCGKARFIPARFHKYRMGETLDLIPREKEVFEILEQAFSQYHELAQSLKADQVETYRDLVKLVQGDLKQTPDRAREIVNLWFDFYPEDYVQAILSSDLGSHNKQAEVFGYLDVERRVNFFHRALSQCFQMGLKGIDAGSYMLGRFAQEDQGISFWNRLSDKEIAFVLNEWIQYRKYRDVLLEVGEHRIARARKILTVEPERPLEIRPVDAKTFLRLKLSRKQGAKVEQALPDGVSLETRQLIELLKKPFSFFFDYRYPWSLNPLKKICAEEGVPVPDPEEV